MARDDPHFRLRIPAELKARIEHAATTNGRSVNAEIVAALEQKYPDPMWMVDLAHLQADIGHQISAGNVSPQLREKLAAEVRKLAEVLNGG
jgi:hypothetical protein